jgi:lipoyl(octanoyl) transferase
MTHWRLLLSGSNDPAANMAIDEAVLRAYQNCDAAPTLRIYGWKPKGISLGYFQYPEKVLNLKNCSEYKIPFVRRITGGESIFHDDDLSYSIICSRKDLAELTDSVKESFKILSSFIIKAYKTIGLDAGFFCEAGDAGSTVRPSDFCFAKTNDFDISVCGRKLGGNAQKRIKKIIFQHGSIPLTLDVDRIKLFFREELSCLENSAVSLEKAAGRKIDFHELSSILEHSFRESFHVSLSQGELSPFEKVSAARLKEDKYNNQEWNKNGAKTGLAE